MTAEEALKVLEEIREGLGRIKKDVQELRQERNDLLAACEAQHNAIDILFALLIQKCAGFLPSQSGQPWEALIQGKQAIAKAQKS